MTCPGESTPRPALREAISETRSTPSPEAREIPPDPLALGFAQPDRCAGPPLVRAGPSARLTARPRPYLQAAPCQLYPRRTMSHTAAGPPLRGRHQECEALDRLLEDVRAGQSRCWCCAARRASARPRCLEYLRGRASGCRLARAAGVESEMELAFAGLHQLCAPMLDHLERLPGPQRDALHVAFGLTHGDRAGSVPGRAGGAQPARRGGRGAAAGLRGRRRAVARPGLRADARVRRAPAARRAGGAGVRGA